VFRAIEPGRSVLGVWRGVDGVRYPSRFIRSRRVRSAMLETPRSGQRVAVRALVLTTVGLLRHSEM
jgi:hypothetical protein